jgi:hypothetical protein
MFSDYSAVFLAALPLLTGAVLNYAMNGPGRSPLTSPVFDYLKMGVYCGEFFALAVWLAWGPRSLLRRAAEVFLLSMAWSLAAWAGFWMSRPDNFRQFGGEALQILTVGPLALALGAIPLGLMRQRFHFIEASPAPTRSKFMRGSCVCALLCLVLAVAVAYFAKGRDFGWDLLTAVILGVILGLIASAVAPLLARGFLNEEINARRIFVAVILLVGLAILPSGLLAEPGPGAAGANSPKAPVILAAMTASPCVIVAFWFWRSLGLKVASGTRNAEPGVRADSR